MNLMDLRAIYQMKSLSKGGWVKYRMPYLLRNLLIDRPNQVWCQISHTWQWSMASCTYMPL